MLPKSRQLVGVVLAWMLVGFPINLTADDISAVHTRGEEADTPGPLSHSRPAVRHDHPETFFALGLVYEYGHGVDIDQYRAAQYYFQAGAIYAVQGARDKFTICVTALRRLNPDHPFLKSLLEISQGPQHRAA
jgi:hypothetical protein